MTVSGGMYTFNSVSSAWTLFCRHLPKLPRLLESEDVNMRIAAGETIALLFELARDMDAVSSNHVSFNIQDLIIPVIHCSQLSGLNCCCLMPFNWSLNAAFLYVCFRSLNSTTGMNCVTNWTRWPRTVTSTEPRPTRGSSGRCSGTCSRLWRWVFTVGWQHLILQGFNLHFGHHLPPHLCSSRRETSSLRPFALGRSAWPLTAGSERGPTMPSGSLWALGWTTTYRYLSDKFNLSKSWSAQLLKRLGYTVVINIIPYVGSDGSLRRIVSDLCHPNISSNSSYEVQK